MSPGNSDCIIRPSDEARNLVLSEMEAMPSARARRLGRLYPPSQAVEVGSKKVSRRTSATQGPSSFSSLAAESMIDVASTGFLRNKN
jgi:hypothetical protein